MKPLASSLPSCDCIFFIRCHKHNHYRAFKKTTLIALAIALSPSIPIVFGFCPSRASTNCFKTQIKEIPSHGRVEHNQMSLSFYYD